MCSAGGVPYCDSVPMDYLTTLLMLHAWLPYTFTYSRLLYTAPASAIGSLAAVLALVLVHTSARMAMNPMVPARDWVNLVFWVLFAHAIGVAHLVARRTDVWELSALRLRQRRLIRSLQEETESCEQLLANILPEHVLKSLGTARALMQLSDDAAHDAKGNAISKEAAGLIPQHSLGVLVCESYQDCSFLFAKINGLAGLVNDTSRKATDVLNVLQVIFDRFDALADMFGVQKVRKTANEYYLAAAGLPNPDLLPNDKHRACGMAAFGFALLNIMHRLNLELSQYNVAFSLQVGIHSGDAIAGVIGVKTYQYDLVGDAVNTAARMCSYSSPGHVHVSEKTYVLLKHQFDAVCRGSLDIKGKGSMKTYYLVNTPPQDDGMMVRGLESPVMAPLQLPSPP